MRALLAGHRDEYAALLAPEWRVTHIDGRVQTKAQVLERMFGGPSPLAELAVDDVEVRVSRCSGCDWPHDGARTNGTRVVLRSAIPSAA